MLDFSEGLIAETTNWKYPHSNSIVGILERSWCQVVYIWQTIQQQNGPRNARGIASTCFPALFLAGFFFCLFLEMFCLSHYSVFFWIPQWCGWGMALNVLGSKYIRGYLLMRVQINMSFLVSIFQIYWRPHNEYLRHAWPQSPWTLQAAGALESDSSVHCLPCLGADCRLIAEACFILAWSKDQLKLKWFL